VLDDNTPIMSERGTAELLGMKQKTLKAMRGNFVNVATRNSPYFGREIVKSNVGWISGASSTCSVI